MKSADYVRTVTSIWRVLLDEGRCATPEEMRELSDAFSRGGFTDGYFTGKISPSMMGVRSEEDKARSASLASKPIPKQGFLPVDMTADIHVGAPITLTVSTPVFRENSQRIIATAECEAPKIALNRPTSSDDVAKNLSKTGGTAYRANNVTVHIDDGLMIPLSRINSLRRDALCLLDAARAQYVEREISRRARTADREKPLCPTQTRSVKRTARFLYSDRITKKALEYFDLIYLPLNSYQESKTVKALPSDKLGVILPPVIFDREKSEVRAMLCSALSDGIKRVMLGNIGHIELIAEAAGDADVEMPRLCGDYRLNVTNSSTAKALEELGINEFILSPELSLPKIRDIHGDAACVVYGRITLMTLEKCAIRELYGKNACSICAEGNATMRDRRGICFPVIREWKHRNVILNSLPLSMTDKEEDLRRANISSRHFIFTTEDSNAVDSVISAAQNQTHVGEEVRRISK
jgi:putative protease